MGARRGVLHEDAFGHLQFEIVRRQASLLQDQGNPFEKAFVPELHELPGFYVRYRTERPCRDE